MANVLLRYLKPKGWLALEEVEDNLEDFINNLIANLELSPL